MDLLERDQVHLEIIIIHLLIKDKLDILLVMCQMAVATETTLLVTISLSNHLEIEVMLVVTLLLRSLLDLIDCILQVEDQDKEIPYMVIIIQE